MASFSLGAEEFIVGAFRTWEGAGHCPGRGCGQALGGGLCPSGVLSLRLFQAFGSLLATHPSPRPLGWPKGLCPLASLTLEPHLLRHPDMWSACCYWDPAYISCLRTLPLAVSSAQITLSLMSCPQVFSGLQGSGSVSSPRKGRALFLSPAPHRHLWAFLWPCWPYLTVAGVCIYTGDPELDGRCPLRLPSIFSSNTGAQGSEAKAGTQLFSEWGKL